MNPRHVHPVPDYSGATKEERVERVHQIIRICREHGYEYVFAGYGFMAEDEEFVSAIEDAGLRFIEEQSVETSKPLSNVLRTTRLGISLALIGSGTLLVANLWDRTLGENLYVVLALGGTIALTAGTGFLIAAAISYKLCRSLGLISKVNTIGPDVR